MTLADARAARPQADGVETFGAYFVVRGLGDGPSGTLLRAWDKHGRRWVALRVFRSASAEERARFAQAGRRAVEIEHPGVQKVFDAGEEGDVPFVAGEFLRGASLAADGEADLGRRLEALCDAAEALQAVHDRGLIHGNVKPSNVFLADRTVVLDVGLPTRRPTSWTAPELEKSWSVAGDVYGLGATLYWVLVGKAPYQGTPEELADEIRSREPEWPRYLDRGLDPALDRIVRRAMARRPADRFESARAFGEALRECLRGKPRTRGRGWVIALAAGALAAAGTAMAVMWAL